MKFQSIWKRINRIRFNTSGYVPTWGQEQNQIVSLLFWEVMGKVGISDWHTYFQKLALPITLCVGIGLTVGAYQYGFWGAVLGAIAAVIAPAALVAGALVLIYATAIFLIFVAMWAAIVWLFILVFFP